MSELCGAFSGTSVVAAFKNLSHGVRKEELWTSEPAESQKKRKILLYGSLKPINLYL